MMYLDRVFKTLSLVTSALLLFGCASTPLPTQSNQPASNSGGKVSFDSYVSEFLPFIQSDKRQSIIDLLGEPKGSQEKSTPNTHNPDQMDAIEAIVYNDLQIYLYKINKSNENILILGVDVTGPGHTLKDGIQVGDSISEVTALLGEADQRNNQGDESIDIYCDSFTGQNCLMFHHRNKIIKIIKYEAYVD
jgi:hypothetical protein